jgi:mannosyltransferase
MLYTHAWALFYGAGSFIAVCLLFRISGPEDRKYFVRDALGAYIGAGILFVPWLPNFIFQTLNTAAPWDSSPQLGAPVQLSKDVLGGDSITAATLLATFVGVSDLVLRRNRGTKLAHTLFILFAIPTFTLILAWAASQLTPAWSPRYFAPIVPPILLLLALGMSRAGIIGAGALIFACIFLSHPAAYAPADKSDVQYLAYEVAPHLHKGDLVIVGQPEQVPLNYYYLPSGLRFSSTIGPVKDPTYMNWVKALHRYRDAVPSKVLPPMIKSLKAGQQVLFVRPLTEGNTDWDSPWTRLIRRSSAQWGAILQNYVNKGELKPELWAPHNYVGSCCVADSAVLYKKVG